MAISKVTISDTTHDIVAGGITYCTCETAAATTAKVATVASGNFSLFIGATVNVKFTKANTIASPTLNVANTGAKAIYWHGSALTSSQYWEANSVLNFIYNGNQWDLIGVAKDNNTTYSTGTSSASGLTKLYTTTGTNTDGTMTQSAIKTALDGKQAAGNYAVIDVANTFNGEQKMLNDSYCPTMNDIAVGIGCSLKNSRACDNQLIAAEIYAPCTTVSDNVINMQSVSGELPIYTMNGTNNGQFSSKTQLARFTASGIYEGTTLLSDKYSEKEHTHDYSKVSFSRSLNNGTKIGTITIDGTGTDLYTPTSAVIVVSSTQPTNQNTGDLWYKVIN